MSLPPSETTRRPRRLSDDFFHPVGESIELVAVLHAVSYTWVEQHPCVLCGRLRLVLECSQDFCANPRGWRRAPSGRTFTCARTFDIGSRLSAKRAIAQAGLLDHKCADHFCCSMDVFSKCSSYFGQRWNVIFFSGMVPVLQCECSLGPTQSCGSAVTSLALTVVHPIVVSANISEPLGCWTPTNSVPRSVVGEIMTRADVHSARRVLGKLLLPSRHLLLLPSQHLLLLPSQQLHLSLLLPSKHLLLLPSQHLQSSKRWSSCMHEAGSLCRPRKGRRFAIS